MMEYQEFVLTSGTNPSIVDPTKITNFVKSVNQIVKKQSPSLLLSACICRKRWYKNLLWTRLCSTKSICRCTTTNGI